MYSHRSLYWIEKHFYFIYLISYCGMTTWWKYRLNIITFFSFHRNYYSINTCLTFIHWFPIIAKFKSTIISIYQCVYVIMDSNNIVGLATYHRTLTVNLLILESFNSLPPLRKNPHECKSSLPTIKAFYSQPLLHNQSCLSSFEQKKILVSFYVRHCDIFSWSIV